MDQYRSILELCSCTSIGRYWNVCSVPVSVDIGTFPCTISVDTGTLFLVHVDTGTSSVYVGIVSNHFETRGNVIERNNFRPFSSKSEHF